MADGVGRGPAGAAAADVGGDAVDLGGAELVAEGQHRRAVAAVFNRVADEGVGRQRQHRGIAQRGAGAAFALRAVAAGAVVGVHLRAQRDVAGDGAVGQFDRRGGRLFAQPHRQLHDVLARQRAAHFLVVAAHRRAGTAVGDGFADDVGEARGEQLRRLQRRRMVVGVARAVGAVAQGAVLLVATFGGGLLLGGERRRAALGQHRRGGQQQGGGQAGQAQARGGQVHAVIRWVGSKGTT